MSRVSGTLRRCRTLVLPLLLAKHHTARCTLRHAHAPQRPFRAIPGQAIDGCFLQAERRADVQAGEDEVQQDAYAVNGPALSTRTNQRSRRRPQELVPDSFGGASASGLPTTLADGVKPTTIPSVGGCAFLFPPVDTTVLNSASPSRAPDFEATSGLKSSVMLLMSQDWP
eukprot:scaffold273_cov349-Prasinococcus_capsulatus_cf.AAC.6